MGIKRYLIYFSYIGTQFRGVQRQVNRNLIANADPSTVQGLIEYAITRLKPKNEIVLFLASRTDQGVHALKTAASVDLEFDYDITPLYIHNFLNGFFDETELDIRILEVLRVSKDFNARKLPLWRKYIYRFATIKPDSTIPEHLIRKKLLPIPITEKYRCYYVPQTKFDIEKFNSAAELFIGTKDFISFMAKGGEVTEEVSTVRRINSIGVERAQPFIPSPIDENYNYWHLFCEGKSFLYKQVRKTVSILLAVAEGKISLNTVEKMIEEPSPSIWPRNVSTAPSHGLYLAEVFYHPQDLEIPLNELEVEEKEQNKENVYNDESLDNMDPLEKNKILIKRRLAKYKDNQDETVQTKS